MNVKKINKIKEKSTKKGEKQELPPPPPKKKERKRNKEHEKPQTNKHQTPL